MGEDTRGETAPSGSVPTGEGAVHEALAPSFACPDLRHTLPLDKLRWTG